MEWGLGFKQFGYASLRGHYWCRAALTILKIPLGS